MVRNYKRKTEDRWSKNDLLEALFSIHNGELKLIQASKKYGISRATLYRQYRVFVETGAQNDVNQFKICGGSSILNRVEEDILEKTVLDLRAGGCAISGDDIKRICFEYCYQNGVPNMFDPLRRKASDDWYYGFIKRHPAVRMTEASKKNKIKDMTIGKNESGPSEVEVTVTDVKVEEDHESSPVKS